MPSMHVAAAVRCPSGSCLARAAAARRLPVAQVLQPGRVVVAAALVQPPLAVTHLPSDADEVLVEALAQHDLRLGAQQVLERRELQGWGEAAGRVLGPACEKDRQARSVQGGPDARCARRGR